MLKSLSRLQLYKEITQGKSQQLGLICENVVSEPRIHKNTCINLSDMSK